ncbi:RecQ family ATP-dependent DNA helicase [Agrococcus carbonis]|uniref:RecQ family ATP-dependent DNA helicase n=1 Tax=Agrococcus carbonis TaxID=684552 RepID=UPI000AB2670C
MPKPQPDPIAAAAADYGWEQLREGQREAVELVLAGHDVLAVMPTGYGKSAIYQLAGRLTDRATIVVSPLIALQRDQVEQLDELGADGAVAVNSSQRVAENREAWEELEAGDAEFVFLAPEQLARDDVIERLRALRPSLVVVDEAHCVSAWGHDFRPDYLRLGHVIEALGHPTTIALTATAAPPVRDEIVERLRMRDARQVVRGFDRPNIFLEAHREHDDDDRRRAIVARAAAEAKPGLVYVATRKEAERVAEALREAGMAAEVYHAGMARAERERVHEAFTDGSAEVVAATSAFGMGIDKADVRFVLHAAPPDSPDSYYQEIGRAGRDGEPALAALYFRQEDFGLHRFRTAARPTPRCSPRSPSACGARSSRCRRSGCARAWTSGRPGSRPPSTCSSRPARSRRRTRASSSGERGPSRQRWRRPRGSPRRVAASTARGAT